ncbi:cytochrome P450 [Novosphingobium sp. JCM 18896]|uniref:cytochrome P450 n=1 Tax=Novosphingobium sp. JCM 18896 TaxID=2989731 RepID=UPI0022232D6F|nr:cytochrome P450 [Novosphingobium sp. JCM 18896]MCW1431714.1 cytochrome P450 [Novosphingobium sp. JCM 18896]
MEQMETPSLNIDLYAPQMLADPWATLARIREAGPLVWNEQGYWMTAHDRLCRQILTQPDRLGQEGLIASLFGEEAFISIDDRGLHNGLRDVWVATFGQKGVESLAPFVRQVIHDMLDQALATLGADGQVDLVRTLCRPLPAHVIARMMGVAPDMIPMIIAWSDRMAEATSGGFPIDYTSDPAWLASEQAKAELADYIRAQIRFRRAAPGEDLISAMIHSDMARTLSDEAMMVNIRQLLFAGNETTSNWLGHIVMTFAERPGLRETLLRDPGLVPAAMEEIMRWQGVTQVLPRGVGGQGAEIAGVNLPPGAEVILLIGAAGRDPARWEQPDDLDIYREAKPHLAFGFGLHSCLGATLARMEARKVATALLGKLPHFQLAGPVAFGNFSLRGPSSVVVTR